MTLLFHSLQRLFSDQKFVNLAWEIQIILEEQILFYHEALYSFCSCIFVYRIVVFLQSDTLLTYYFHINSLMFLIKQTACIILITLCSEVEGLIPGGCQTYSWAGQ